MQTILGTGQLGRTILEVLLRKNPTEAITLVSKSGKINFPIPANVQILAADVSQMEEMHRIAQKSVIIYSCTDMSYPLWASFYPAITQAIIQGLKNTSAKLVFADNLYSYGNLKGKIMLESMPHSATTKKGIIRADVVEAFLQANQRQNTKIAVVKAADFIGPYIHKGIFGIDFMTNLLENKSVHLFGNIHLPHAFTFMEDFAQAMINIAQADDTFGQVWHVPNAPAISLHAWVQLFEKQANRRIKLSVVSKNMLRLIGLFKPLLKEYIELSYQFEYPYLVSHQKYAQRFGEHFTKPEQIVTQTLKWYQSAYKKIILN